MVIFCSDLDNTLIYSYKRDIGSEKKCVEIYQDREVSFMTLNSFEMLKEIRRKTVFVPVTTRTTEQYRRIDFGGRETEFALVCNGGILLENGIPSKQWYFDSLDIIRDSRPELDRAVKILEQDENRYFEIRYIDELFVFSKSSRPEQTIAVLQSELDTDKVDVLCNGEKIYAVPEKLNKGTAVKRLRDLLKPEIVIAAGDSEFDIPMLSEANLAFSPEELEKESGRPFSNALLHKKKCVFSDKILDYILNQYEF